MNSAVCTLFEGDHHYGVGALANSLYAHGFRGTIYAGYRGPLPLWAAGAMESHSFAEFSPAEGLTLRFVPIITPIHLAHYKPYFMLELLGKHCQQSQSLFYFDPDIVVRCRWTFFEEWVGCGVGLCQEIVNGYLPSDHPFRTAWKKLAESISYPILRNPSRYYNAGFVAVQARHSSFLQTWHDLIEAVGRSGVPLNKFTMQDPTHPFNGPDQQCLNVASMVAEVPLSTVGPEEMDFTAGGSYMSHATGSPKPWDTKFLLSSILGQSPTRAQKAFWRNTQFPICLFPRHTLLIKQAELKMASVLGRFVRRS
jgi:hypothetical protein